MRIRQLVLQLLHTVGLRRQDTLRDVSIAALASYGLLRHVREHVKAFSLIEEIKS